MAISISKASSSQAFDRHIKRLAWCALLGSLALLVPLVRSFSSTATELVEVLGTIVVVVAVLDVVRDVGRYVRAETTRRHDAVKASRRAGACQASAVIQDRVANLLSVTVGYVDMLSNDEDLPGPARQHAQKALDSALAAARAVSTFRRSLRCDSGIPSELADLRTLQRELQAASAETRDARLVAEAPKLWDVLNDTQVLAIDMLTTNPRQPPEEARLRGLLERINDLTQRLEV